MKAPASIHCILYRDIWKEWNVPDRIHFSSYSIGGNHPSSNHFTKFQIVSGDNEHILVIILGQGCKRKRAKLIAITVIKLVLKFHPMETHSMKESAKSLHWEQDKCCCKSKNCQPHQSYDDILIPVTHIYRQKFSCYQEQVPP